MLTRLIGLLILVASLGVAYIAYTELTEKEEVQCQPDTPSQRISTLIREDFKKLAETKSLPLEWGQISKTVYKVNSPVTASLMGNERPNLKVFTPKIPTSKEEYEAEVEVIDLPDENNPGFILQVSLLDIKTRNKVFEIGRSYYFSSLNILSKKKPD